MCTQAGGELGIGEGGGEGGGGGGGCHPLQFLNNRFFADDLKEMLYMYFIPV